MLYRILGLSALIYIGIMAFMFLNQRHFIYFPDKTKPDLPASARIAQVKTADGLILEGWYFPPTAPSMPTILYFHGNAGNAGGRFYKVGPFSTHKGYGLLMAEYRGYGGNPGTPSEEGLYADARAYLHWLRGTEKTELKDIVIYGESLGTGVAVQLALENHGARALVLETPYTSMLDLARRIYPFLPVQYLLLDRYMNIEKIPQITELPTLILHGHRDMTIPFADARKLFEATNQPKMFKEYPKATHNNLYDYGAMQDIIDFLVDIQRGEE